MSILIIPVDLSKWDELDQMSEESQQIVAYLILNIIASGKLPDYASCVQEGIRLSLKTLRLIHNDKDAELLENVVKRNCEPFDMTVN